MQRQVERNVNLRLADRLDSGSQQVNLVGATSWLAAMQPKWRVDLYARHSPNCLAAQRQALGRLQIADLSSATRTLEPRTLVSGPLRSGSLWDGETTGQFCDLLQQRYWIGTHFSRHLPPCRSLRARWPAYTNRISLTPRRLRIRSIYLDSRARLYEGAAQILHLFVCMRGPGVSPP